MSETRKELKALSDDRLDELFDCHAQHTQVGTLYYLDEIRYRELSEATNRMNRITNQIWWFTFVSTIAAIIAAVAAIVPIFHH